MDGDRKAKRPNRISIETTDNGGHIVHHSFDNFGSGESYRKDEKHAFKSHAEMMAHVGKVTGGKAPTGVGRPMTGTAPSTKTHGAGVD